MSAERLRRRAVFVDTSAYGALADIADQDHQAAVAINRYLTRTRLPLFTTNFGVAETHTLVLSRVGRDVAYTVLQRLPGSWFGWERRTSARRAESLLRITTRTSHWSMG